MELMIQLALILSTVIGLTVWVVKKTIAAHETLTKGYIDHLKELHREDKDFKKEQLNVLQGLQAEIKENSTTTRAVAVAVETLATKLKCTDVQRV